MKLIGKVRSPTQKIQQTICLNFLFTDNQTYIIKLHCRDLNNCPILKKTGLLLNVFENSKLIYIIKPLYYNILVKMHQSLLSICLKKFQTGSDGVSARTETGIKVTG